MKYRVLTPQELEVYNIGYKVGHDELIITDVIWESDSEKKIYRRGYNAGIKKLYREQEEQRQLLGPTSAMSNKGTMSASNECQKKVNKVDNINSYLYLDLDIDLDTEDKSRKDIKNLSTTPARARGVNPQISPPDLETVFAFAKEQNSLAGCGGFKCDRMTAEEFWSKYSANGWRECNDARTPIVDWCAKLRQWSVNEQRGRFKSKTELAMDDIPDGPKIAEGDN